MRTTHGLTTAALGILAALAAFVGCKSSASNATAEGGGDQRAVSGAQRPPTCNLVCTTAQDCGIAPGLEDASHFQCTAGRCQWQGCKSKAECTQAFQSENYICAQEGTAPVPTCIRVCAAAAGPTQSVGALHSSTHPGTGAPPSFTQTNLSLWNAALHSALDLHPSHSQRPPVHA